MENLSIAIVTKDKAYGKALSMSLINVCPGLRIKLYNSKGFISEWTKYNINKKKDEKTFYRCFDIVLWDGDEIRSAYGDSIVFLADRQSMTCNNYQAKKFCIYKYSPAQTMVAAIFDIYACLTGRRAHSVHLDNVRLFAFGSWIGGSGCTSIALAAAQELVRFRKMRVLYISFEEIESTGCFMEVGSGVKNTGEFLYRLFNPVESEPTADNKNVLPFLNSFLIKDLYGINAFAPTRGRNPLVDLGERETEKFIATLVDSGNFEVIIMDMGSCLSRAGVSAIRMAEKLCAVTAGIDEGGREEAYLSHLMYRCNEHITDKIIKVENKTQKQGIKSSENSMLDVKHSIRNCKYNSLQGQVKDITLEGEFGQDISGLVDKLLEPGTYK